MTNAALLTPKKTEGRVEKGSKVGSNLFAFSLNPFEYGFKSALRESRLLASFLIILVSLTKSFGSEVECVAKWLMDASQNVSASHENLVQDLAIGTPIDDVRWEVPSQRPYCMLSDAWPRIWVS
jgi:hypothetical protein